MLERPDVVYPAVAVQVECHPGGDVLAVELPDQHVVGGGIGAGEEILRHTHDAQVLGPVRRREVNLRPWQGDVVECHSHRACRLVERVAAPFQVGAHRLVALVHPGGEMRDAGSRISRLHHVDGVGALEQSVVIDTALRLVREDGRRDAREAPHLRVAYELLDGRG